jgi:Gpi18-like mannosyltransferase
MTRDTRTLLFLLAAGALIRLLASMPDEYHSDLTLFREWGVKANIYGILTVYDEKGHYDLPGYPPLAPYLVWIMDNAGNGLKRVFGDFDAFKWLFRLFILLTDLATALLIFMFHRRSGHARLLCAFYFLNPAVIMNGVVWGQIDNLFVLFVAASVLAVFEKRPLWAGSLYALACLTKMQAAVFAPLLGLVLAFELRTREILKFSGAFLSVFLLFCAPFIVVGRFGLIMSFFVTSASICPYFSMNAFNLWWLASGGAGMIPDSQVLFCGLSAKTAGLFLFALAYAGILLGLFLRYAGKRVFFALALLSFAFYMLPTQMHERYLYPFCVFWLLMPALARKDRWFYTVLSLLYFLNLAAVFSMHRRYDNPLNTGFTPVSVLIAVANLLVFGYCVWRAIEAFRVKKDAPHTSF